MVRTGCTQMGMKRIVAAGALALAPGAGMAQESTAAPPPAAAPIIQETEENDVARLPPARPHWVYVTDAFGMGGTRIIDGDSGRLLGTVHAAPLGDFTAAPDGKRYYVTESVWTRGNRGTRQDLLAVYDQATLNLLEDIPLPGRLLIGNRAYAFVTSADGRFGYVFNMAPASSIVVVDLVRRKVVRSVEVPGCGLVMPAPDGTTASLCSDGSMATVAYDATPRITRSPVFFSAEQDPVFDNSAVDKRTGKALFLSYSGLIYEARLGATPTIAAPWSLQEAGGMPRGETRPLMVNWLPGGRQPIAWHRGSGRAYVLMHMGEYWSHGAAGSEVWEVDVTAHKVLRRMPLASPATYIAVSQGPDPQLYLNGSGGKLSVVDVATLHERHKLSNVGVGSLSVPDS
jgi:methylamine dehydrogenase heavy chain